MAAAAEREEGGGRREAEAVVVFSGIESNRTQPKGEGTGVFVLGAVGWPTRQSQVGCRRPLGGGTRGP